MSRAWLLAVILSLSPLAIHAQAIPPPTPNGAIWLQPSDALIAKAIDDGFAQKKLPKNALYHKVLNWLKPGLDARIEIVPPLMCALDEGQYAHDNLQSKPTVASVKADCWNSVTVMLIHYSQNLNANWPCVFQNGDTTLQATVKTLDANPSVQTYYPGGFSTEDVAGYRYKDAYTFTIPLDWPTSASLVYADERGIHHTYIVDFNVFIKDVTSRQ
jgi:hypothetical protein